ncbi:hypothetical protein ACFSKL_09820 [Belliella marina]|uniref:Uncharacterized protein n=1 Tax=Belliella marina TaxID=1644146 RepID=A0ABW4VKC4_9BACT
MTENIPKTFGNRPDWVNTQSVSLKHGVFRFNKELIEESIIKETEQATSSTLKYPRPTEDLKIGREKTKKTQNQ